MNLEELLASLGLSEDDIAKVVEASKPNDEISEIKRLRKHNEQLLAEKKARQAKMLDEKERLEQEQARKAGDFEALEQQYKQRIEKLEQEIKQRDQQRDADLVKTESMRLASELSDNANNREILQTLLSSRLVAEDGQIKVRDASGGITISTLDDLKNEILKSGKYDALITGTLASGTGGTGQGGSGTKQASEYTETERLDMATNNPALFKTLFGVTS